MPMAHTNKAAWALEPKARYIVEESPFPVAGADEIIIRNRAVAINQIDVKIQLEDIFNRKYPSIEGCEAAGVIVEVGSNVKRFREGDRVIGPASGLLSGNPRDGSFQNYVPIQAHIAAKLPDSITFVEGVVLPLAILTGAQGLFDKDYLGLPMPSLAIKPVDQFILIWGGSSSVGLATIQLAVAAGLRVIATASERNHILLQSVGATVAVDHSSSSAVKDILKHLDGNKLAAVFDATSNESTIKACVEVLKNAQTANGVKKLAHVLPVPEQLLEGIKASYLFGPLFAQTDSGSMTMRYVEEALAQGLLKTVPEAQVVGKGLDCVQKGIDRLNEGVSAKKIVIEL